MEIRKLEGLSGGFSRVYPTTASAVNGISINGGEYEDYGLQGLQLQGSYDRCKALNGLREGDGHIINGLELQGLVQGYSEGDEDDLDEWEFLVDIEHPVALNGFRDWKRRRQGKKLNRKTRRAKNKTMRAAKKARRQAVKAQRQSIRERKKAVRVARKEQRLQRKMMKAKARAGRGGFGEQVANVFNQAKDFIPGMRDQSFSDILEPSIGMALSEYDMIPPGFSPRQAMDQMSNMQPDELVDWAMGEEDDIIDYGDESGQRGLFKPKMFSKRWWRKLPGWQKGLIIGGGSAAAIGIGDAVFNKGKLVKSITKKK